MRTNFRPGPSNVRTWDVSNRSSKPEGARGADAPEPADVEIPDEIPLLPIRDLVIFPFMIVPLIVRGEALPASQSSRLPLASKVSKPGCRCRTWPTSSVSSKASDQRGAAVLKVALEPRALR